MSIINNAWTISLVSILIGIVVTALFGWCRDWVLSRKGELSGTYIEYAANDDKSTIKFDVVRCRHAGNRLYGEIMTRIELSQEATGKKRGSMPEWKPKTVEQVGFKFTGRMLGRQIVLSYWSTGKGSHDCGTITMDANYNASALIGIWGGRDSEEGISSGPSMWIRAGEGYNRVREADPGKLEQYSIDILQQNYYRWSQG